MTDQIQLFNNPEFGDIRTTVMGDSVLFCGKDIAEALGYASPANAIAAHCKGVITDVLTQTSGGPQTMKYISEGDAYRLICNSHMPNAMKFEHWVFNDLLPVIRKRICASVKNNSYMKIMDNNQLKDLLSLQLNKKSGFMGFFYVLDYGDGSIKIGSSAFPYKRILHLISVARKYGNAIICKFALSPQHTNYRQNESMLHAFFSDSQRDKSERFDVSFDAAVELINSLSIKYEDKTDELTLHAAEVSNNMINMFKAMSPTLNNILTCNKRPTPKEIAQQMIATDDESTSWHAYFNFNDSTCAKIYEVADMEGIKYQYIPLLALYEYLNKRLSA